MHFINFINELANIFYITFEINEIFCNDTYRKTLTSSFPLICPSFFLYYFFISQVMVWKTNFDKVDYEEGKFV